MHVDVTVKADTSNGDWYLYSHSYFFPLTSDAVIEDCVESDEVFIVKDGTFRVVEILCDVAILTAVASPDILM